MRLRHAAHVALLSLLGVGLGCSILQRRDAAPSSGTNDGQPGPAPSGARSPQGPKELEVAFKAQGDVKLTPTTERVKLFRSASEAPAGFQRVPVASGTVELRAMKDFPTAAQPHRVIGKISIVEKRSNPNREKIDWETEELTARRTRALEAEAARVGANGLVLEREEAYFEVNRSVRTASYYAVVISSAVAEKPTVDVLISRMALEKDGFKIAKRFTAKLEDLGTRAPETFQLKRGYATLLAVAFHPEAEPGARFGLRLKTGKSEEDIRSIDYRASAGIDGFHGAPLDGISRAAAGWISHGAFRAEPVSISFGPHAPGAASLDAGKGPVEIVIYERALSAAEQLEAACAWCSPAAKRCTRRRPFEHCAELKTCFSSIQVPLGKCVATYE